MNPVTNAIRASFASQETLCGEEAVYRRGGKDFTLTVVPGRTVPDIVGQVPESLAHREADWLALADDLILDGLPITPARGDELTVGDVTYRLVPRDEGECFRFNDPHRIVVRMFCVWN